MVMLNPYFVIHIRESNMNEYALYQEFEEFGTVVRLTKMRKQRYGFISYSTESEANKAVSRYNRDLFDCRVMGHRSGASK